MVLFGTREWLDCFCRLLNENPAYREAASTYEGTITCEVLPPGRNASPLFFYLDPYHGKIREWDVLRSPDERKADFVITAKYGIWKKICQGKLSMINALMLRKLKVDGQTSLLLKYAKAAQVLMRTMVAVPTRFHDE